MPGLAPYIRTLEIGKRTTIDATGTTVFLRRAIGEITVTLRSTATGERDGVAYTLRMTEAEKWFHAEQFDSVTIENTSGVANEIEFYIGFGDFEKPVPDIVNVQVTLAPNSVAETIADKVNIDVGNAGKELLLPADANRIEAYITALAANAEVIRVGDENVTETRGTPLAAGETLIWKGPNACYACSIATVNQSAAISLFSSQ